MILNRYLEGMDNGQKTPHGHPDFNSYVKILCVFIDNGQLEKLIWCGLGMEPNRFLQVNPVWAG